MNLIDLLLQLQIPAWLVLLLVIVGTLAMTYYRHRLDRKVKELEHRLEKEATNHEKDLEFVQERHKKRLEALDDINRAVMEFAHAFDHLRGGNSYYADRLEEKFHTSRTLARKYESLLGAEFYQAVKDMTDAGMGILHANFILNNDGFNRLEARDLPMSALNLLRSVIEKPIPVTDAEQLVHGIDEKTLFFHKRDIFSSCKLSQEFNSLEYHKAESNIQKLKRELLQTLPRPTSQS
jgi:hypothetical protein